MTERSDAHLQKEFTDWETDAAGSALDTQRWLNRVRPPLQREYEDWENGMSQKPATYGCDTVRQDTSKRIRGNGVIRGLENKVAWLDEQNSLEEAQQLRIREIRRQE